MTRLTPLVYFLLIVSDFQLIKNTDRDQWINETFYRTGEISDKLGKMKN